MQVLIKTVDGSEETAYTQSNKFIATEKNVVTLPLVEEPTRDDSGRSFDRFIHLDNLVFYRYFPEEMRGNCGTGKTLTVKTKNGDLESVEGVSHFYASNFYLVVEAHDCITNFPLKNVLSYDVE